MSDKKKKYRVYVRFEEEYIDVEAKSEDEAEDSAFDYFLTNASIYTQDIEELQRRNNWTVKYIYSYRMRNS